MSTRRSTRIAAVAAQQKIVENKRTKKRQRPPTTKTFLDSAQNFPVCQHILQSTNLSVPKVSKIIQRPLHWRCEECEHSGDAWICLTCGHVGCGRFLGRHAYTHSCASHKKGTHDLAFCLSNGNCFCYRCDEYVISDNQHGELDALQKELWEVLLQSTATTWDFNRNHGEK